MIPNGQGFPANVPQYQGAAYNQFTFNPYAERMNQLQTFQQSLQYPSPQQPALLSGRVVDAAESIMANDVPMDGSFSIFPKRDMTEVYVKYWTGEGKIATLVFRPVADTTPGDARPLTESPALEEFARTLNDIEVKVDSLTNRLEEALKSKSTARTKKEVAADE